MTPTMQHTDTPMGYVDKPFTLVYNFTLNLAQTLANQIIQLDNDADFYLRSVYSQVNTQYTSFTYQFNGPAAYFFQQTPIPSFILSNNSGQSFPILPEVWYPAGGQIKITVTNTNTAFAGPNTYALYFVGVKRFKVQA